MMITPATSSKELEFARWIEAHHKLTSFHDGSETPCLFLTNDDSESAERQADACEVGSIGRLRPPVLPLRFR
jgi:hypothetical protein